MNVVFASHTHMGGAFVVGSHHLAAALTEQGHQVVHIGAPLSPFHVQKWQDPETAVRLKLWRSGGTLVNGVPNYVPMGLLPWPVIRHLHLPTQCYAWSVPTIRSVLARWGMKHVDVLLMDEPRFFGLEKQLRAQRLIYRATDLYGAMRQDPTIDALEQRIVAVADGLIGTSAPVVRHLESLGARQPVHLFENGVDLRLFNQHTQAAEPERLASIARPRAIYVGAFDERFDFEAVTALARAIPHLQLVLIGPGGPAQAQKLGSLPNVHLIGPLPYRDIPAWMGACDLALLPLSDHPANAGRSPMKIYEYGASGLPVISRSSSELARRAENFVHLYQNHADMVSLTRSLLDHPERLASHRRHGMEASRSRGWDQIARNITMLAQQHA